MAIRAKPDGYHTVTSYLVVSVEHPAMPAMLYLYVVDVDATYRQAVAAGAVSRN
jgi:uncharacterized glyoxalase superfamily protein PhnB